MAAEIERRGAVVTGTGVDVGAVEIRLREGRGTVRGLDVANPEGFSSEPVLALGEVTLDIDPTTVTSSPIVVDEVVIGAPRVRFEVDASGRSNVQALLDNLERSGGGAGGGGSVRDDDGPSVRLRVRRFTFRDGRGVVDTRALGGEAREIDLPPLSLEGLGGEEGAPPDDIARRVLRAYAQKVMSRAASQELRGVLEKTIEKHLGDRGDEAEAARGLLDRLLD